MDNKGFIKLFRTILDWEWFTDINTCHLFIYCLLKANFKDKEWRGQIIKRGSFITSQNTIVEETGLSKQNVKMSLKKLNKLVTKKSTSRNTIISIKNFDFYCGFNPSTNPQTNQPLTTTNNDKKNKNINSLSNKTITEDEREVLKKYLLRQKRKPDNLDAYIKTLINNGDWKEIVAKEEKRIKAKNEKLSAQIPTPILFTNSDEEEAKIKEYQQRIRALFKI